jgi:hypothetical protein
MSSSRLHTIFTGAPRISFAILAAIIVKSGSMRRPNPPPESIV